MQPGEKGIDVVRLVSADLVDGELAYWLILLPPTPPRVPPPQVVVVGDPLTTDLYNFSTIPTDFSILASPIV